LISFLSIFYFTVDTDVIGMDVGGGGVIFVVQKNNNNK